MTPRGFPTSVPIIPAPGRSVESHAAPLPLALPRPLFCIRMLAIMLAGYATLGRGFAYLGVKPLFVGEIVLGLLIFKLLTIPLGRWRRVLDQVPVYCLLLLFAWCGFRTIPYLGTYQFDALRDAVLWGYGAYALVVAAVLVAFPLSFIQLLVWFRKYGKPYLFIAPIIVITGQLFSQQLPRLPGAGIPIIDQRAGDVLCHVGSVVSFCAFGLGGHLTWLHACATAVSVALAGTVSRGGLLGFMLIMIGALLVKPTERLPWRVATIGLLAVLMLAVTGIEIHLEARGRAVSFDELAASVESMFGSSEDAADRENTKEWRITWWTQIVEYTFGGEYFWDGKGFGINLANDDGHQVLADSSLRSPHNAHLNILARAGVPGFALWLGVHGSWLWIMISRYSECRRRGQQRWYGLFAFLVLYACSILVIATFDVVMEGPMIGIWYWCLFGVGLAALHLHRTMPDLLADPR